MPRSRRAALLAVLVAVVAGCNPSTATPTTTLRPSASPAASGSPAASASPSPDPSTAAIDAFVKLVTKAGFSYQATFSGEDRHSASILTISKGLLQVHGDDVRVRLTFTDDSGSTTVEHRYVGGKGWVRFATYLAWQRLTIKPAQSMGAFVSIASAKDVTYVEAVQVDGKPFYRVSFPSAIVNPVLIPYVNLTDETLRRSKMTILIDAKGRPIRGTTEINATGRVSGQLQEIIIELTVVFSKVGGPVTISAP